MSTLPLSLNEVSNINWDRLQKVASETKNRDDWKAFNGIRNTVNNRLKFEERS
jgi:hypothetical protein